MLLPGPDGFGRRSPGAHYHTPAFHQSSAYVAASLTHGPQVTDSHFAAHTNPVVAFTDNAATAAHSHLHPNFSAFTYRYGDPGRYRHTDHRTERYAYSYRHSVSHRYTHGARTATDTPSPTPTASPTVIPTDTATATASPTETSWPTRDLHFHALS